MKLSDQLRMLANELDRLDFDRLSKEADEEDGWIYIDFYTEAANTGAPLDDLLRAVHLVRGKYDTLDDLLLAIDLKLDDGDAAGLKEEQKREWN